MRHRLAPFVVLLAAAPAGTAGAQQAAAVASRVPVARVDSLFARFAGTTSPGCAVAATERGQSVLSRAYGMAELEHDVANTPATIFEAGSVSKQFTAAAVVLLTMDGKLSLDDDVRKHIPELPDYGTPVTIRHLMQHTSGLRDWGSVVAMGGWPRGTRTYTHAHMLDVARRQKALNYQPGAHFSYTNTGYNLMAVLVERVSGMPFAQFTRTRLFEPLGMARTSWRDDYARVVKGRAVAYRPAPGGQWRMDMPFENVHGNGGLLTTVDDMLKWTENLKTGAVGGPRFVEEMHRQGRLTSGRQIEYASGLFVTTHRGLREISHGGATAGYRAFLARYPDQQLAVAVLCNAANVNPAQLAHQVADLYLGDVPRDEPEPRAAVEAATLASMAGTYRDARRGETMRLALQGAQLGIVQGPPLVPVGAGRFRAGSSMRVEFRPAANGARAPFDLVAPDGDTVRYEPVADWAPTTAQLATFAGTYRSDEAEVAYTVSVKNAQLVLEGAMPVPVPLTPAYEDAFTVGGNVFRFRRDKAGRPSQLVVVSDRVWALAFDRQK